MTILTEKARAAGWRSRSWPWISVGDTQYYAELVYRVVDGQIVEAALWGSGLKLEEWRAEA